MLLVVTNLITEFRNHRSIFKAIDVSFEIDNAEIVGLVGESGSGKSITALSLLRIGGENQYSTGSIVFTLGNNEIDLMQLTETQMVAIRGKEIGYVFQEPMSALNPIMSCGEQLTEAILLHLRISKVEARNYALQLFYQVELANPEKIFVSYPFQLSAGQKQRVLIAMAICCKPKLLIADEPTTALDTITQQSILQLLVKLKTDLGMSILYITHDLSIVSAIAQKILVLHKGSIVEHGSIRDVYLNPQNEYTKSLIGLTHAKNKRSRKSSLLGLDSMEKIESTNVRTNSISRSINENEVLLRVLNLKTYFKNSKNSFLDKNKGLTKAVNDVSFEIRRGETMGIIGASGCGKTTLARSLVRLVEPTGGAIQYQDNEITTCDKFDLRAYRKKVQLIFQDPYSSLNPRMKVGEMLLEPMKVHGILKNDGERKQRVMNLLSKVNLSSEHYNSYPDELSGGQRQRIVIARALALNPDLIICDECVSALDIATQATILNLLNDLKQEFNLTYIFISHDLNIVSYVSDRILVMDNGKIVEEGTPVELFSNPQTDFTKKLIAAIPKQIIA